MRIHITSFAGITPKLSGHLLSDSQATVALNCKLTDGSLRAYNDLSDVTTLSATPTTLYQYRDGGNTYWFDWDRDVDVARTPIYDDPNNRVYLTGTVNGARWTDNQLALSGGSDYPVNTRQLGIPEPTAPVAVVSGTADADAVDAETRQYTLTWVDENGREGPPSLPSDAVDVLPGQTVILTTPASPGAVDLNITHFRVYTTTAVGTIQLCTQVEASGTDYTDVPVGQTTVIDKTATDARGDTLKTIGWLAAPDDIEGICIHPGGFAVAFRGKELLFSVPYHLYAWPLEYRISTDYAIRSVAISGNSVIIGTEGKPYICFGTEPAAMTLEQLNSTQACVSKRSMVDMGTMVVYASPDGLVGVAGDQPALLTENIINPEDWRDTFRPDTLHACYHDGKYYGFYGDVVNGGSFLYDPAKSEFIQFNTFAEACYRDLEDDTLYVAVGNVVKAWDSAANRLPYTWRSKRYISTAMGYSAARVHAESYTNLLLRIYRDGSLIAEETVTDDQGIRLPAGDGREWQLELFGTDTVYSLTMAESMSEL